MPARSLPHACTPTSPRHSLWTLAHTFHATKAMSKDLTATSSTTIDAPAARVWDALTDPAKIREYMFGTNVVSDWREGSSIIWKGEWKGKPYEDKGEILQMKPPRLLRYSHFSPMSGQPDEPENYHTVTIELEDAGAGTKVTLSQDRNATEEARQESARNWTAMLEGLRKLVEAARTS